MNYMSCVWVVFFCVLGPTTAIADNRLPQSLAAAIQNNGFKDDGIGIYIQDVASGKPLVTFNADRFFNPASVIKLVTTSAALDRLGVGYQWSTEVSYTGTIEGDTLKGDLYFHGNGDPYLTPERFWLLLNRVAIFGIRHISGNVIFDDSYFKPDPIDYGAFDGQPYRSYNVGPNAILVGFQATEFHLSIDYFRAESELHITPFPDSPRMRIVNNIKLIDGGCGPWQKRVNLDSRLVAEMLQVTFSGQYARDCDKKTLYRRVMDTDDHFRHFLLPLWQQLGGSVEGSVHQGTVPAGAHEFLADPSISLAEAVRFINKFSNNVMTRQLLLSLGARSSGPPGTTAKGLIAIKKWLAEKQLDDPALQLDNGAGLSRDTRISPALLGRLLYYNFQQAYMPEFMASLPVTGYDGTMAHRFENEPVIGHAHIKTGLLDFVQTMAGYVTTASGKRYVVVLLHNDPKAHTKAGERLQDEVIRWVYHL